MKAILFSLALVSAGLCAQEASSPNWTERTVEAPGVRAPLKGLMLKSTTATGPVVLMIPGSGPIDRDGNSPMGVKASTYKLLAQQLAAKGITSVRIDKRGLFSSAAAVENPNSVTIQDYALDVRNWVQSSRKETGARCIWLLGHSEGALVALATDPADVCGLMLVAAPGRPMGQLIREQLESNPANTPLLEQAFATIQQLEAGKRVETRGLHPVLQALLASDIQGFLVSAFALDPAKLLASYKKPILIVQGERDLQVSVQDARRLAAADPTAKLVLLPNVNHVLKQVNTNDRSANLASYSDPDLPVPAAVSQAIEDFLSSQSFRTDDDKR